MRPNIENWVLRAALITWWFCEMGIQEMFNSTRIEEVKIADEKVGLEVS